MFPGLGKKKNTNPDNALQVQTSCPGSAKIYRPQIPRNNWLGQPWQAHNHKYLPSPSSMCLPANKLGTEMKVWSRWAGFYQLYNRYLESVLQSMLPGFCAHLTLKLCGFSGDKHSSHTEAKLILSLWRYGWSSPRFSFWRSLKEPSALIKKPLHLLPGKTSPSPEIGMWIAFITWKITRVLLPFWTGLIQSVLRVLVVFFPLLHVCQTEQSAHFNLNKAKLSHSWKRQHSFSGYPTPSGIPAWNTSARKDNRKERKKTSHVCKLCITHSKYKCCVTRAKTD